MANYTAYRDTVDKIRTLLVKQTIKPMAFELFEQETGTPVRQVLPDRSQGEFEFSINGFEGVVDPDSRTVYNLLFDETLLTLNEIASDPTFLYDIGDAVYDIWEEIFGEYRPCANQPNHPGEPPFSTEGLEATLDEICDQWELLCADPQLKDLIGAISDHNHKLAIRFLGADNPETVIDPTSGHELTNLFMNGNIHILYQDADIALLKPEYDIDEPEAILQQQWNAQTAGETVILGERMRRWAEEREDISDDATVIETDNPWDGRIIQGEWPQEAFVVGRDDTPVGLFAHSIDGTRLDPTQNVTKSYIQDVMGFDRDYKHSESRLDLNIGERIRLQGDLAVEYISGDSVSNAGRCPIPIDNHYLALDKGVLPLNEDKSVEPITVQVPDGAYVNIAHDEHENVAVELAGGTYEFYLLTRGLQTSENRPDWNRDDMESPESNSNTQIQL